MLTEHLKTIRAFSHYGYICINNGQHTHFIGNRNNKEIWNGGKINELLNIMKPTSLKHPNRSYIIYKWDGVSLRNMCNDFDDTILDFFKKVVRDDYVLFTASLEKGLEYPTLEVLPTPYTYMYHTPPQYFVSNWSSKLNKAIWCGETSGIDHERPTRKTRLIIYNKVKDNANFVFQFTTTDLKSPGVKIHPIVSKEEQLKYKIILCIDGWAWPGNLSWVLYSGCLPIIISDFQIGITKHLVPWVHFVPAKTDGSDITENCEWVLNNKDKSQIIIENLIALMKKVSTPCNMRDELSRLMNKKSS